MRAARAKTRRDDERDREHSCDLGARANPQASRTVLRALRTAPRPFARSLSTTRVVRDAAPAAAAAEVSPKISSIVDSVEKLTLLEVSELVTALKVSCAICRREALGGNSVPVFFTLCDLSWTEEGQGWEEDGRRTGEAGRQNGTNRREEGQKLGRRA